MYGSYGVYLFFLIYLQVKCEHKKRSESKIPLPYFRRLVEEVAEDLTANSSVTTDHSNLVSFLIKNVQKIYNELNENPETTTPLTTIKAITTTDFTDTTTSSTTDNSIELTSEITDVPSKSIFEYHRKITKPHARAKLLRSYKVKSSMSTTPITSKPYLDEPVQSTDEIVSNTSILTVTETTSTSNELTEKEELMHLSKNLIFFETDRRERDNHLNYYAHNASYYPTGNDISLRSCIYCNNVLSENCNDPRNRLIPSTVCERDDDVCYSQHTPFGLIDRGCYNVNHNLTIYVCSCSLCNYISISEMPFVFSSKRDWLDNVVELSRARHLSKSVFKDMSCLKCESNASAKTGDMLDTANCLEGNIGSIPTEDCEENEVCAVKAIKRDGYLWRGCVKEPLFNFWWAYCDSDLCNYDVITSIYEI